MYNRDNYRILNDDVIKALKQLNTKCQFLIDNQEHFKEIYSLQDRKIIKVVILNYPVFTGAVVEGIPVIDINLFLSYFQSCKMTTRAFGIDDMEEVETVPYYTTEDEFCNNLESYLKESPIVKMYSEQLEIVECSYKLDGLPKIFFRDINPIDTKSTLVENEDTSKTTL